MRFDCKGSLYSVLSVHEQCVISYNDSEAAVQEMIHKVRSTPCAPSTPQKIILSGCPWPITIVMPLSAIESHNAQQPHVNISHRHITFYKDRPVRYILHDPLPLLWMPGILQTPGKQLSPNLDDLRQYFPDQHIFRTGNTWYTLTFLFFCRVILFYTHVKKTCVFGSQSVGVVQNICTECNCHTRNHHFYTVTKMKTTARWPMFRGYLVHYVVAMFSRI